MIIQDSINLIKKELKAIYSSREIESFIQLIFDHLLKLSGIELHRNMNKTLSADLFAEINSYTESLKSEIPIQYILGHTEFFGCEIALSSDVLIPRPETEELVKWIIDDYKSKAVRILDIGTGSGCIAIALKKNLPESKLIAIDISRGALKLAKKNAEKNDTEIDFIEADILKDKQIGSREKYDVIVSNPPYVTVSEKSKMSNNVLKYEPHVALFVADNDALLFYRKICLFAKNNLQTGGRLYFEINEQYGKEVCLLLESFGFKDIILKKDIEGKDRMVNAVWL